MLSIADIANSNGTITIGNPFVIACLELIDDQSLIVWYTRNPNNATDTANYTITGPSARTVVLAQQQLEGNGTGALYNIASRGVRLYLDQPLTVGQWTLSISSSIVSQDSDAFPLPVNTQLVFDLVDKSGQGDLGSNLVESPVSKFIPKSFRSKPVFEAIIAGLEEGDAIVRQQARTAFDQGFVCTASGKYLDTKAGDRGVPKPTKLGISDEAFRKLTIDISNSKLTNDAMLSVLETMYGADSVRAYVEAPLYNYFEVFDKGTLDFLIDGKVALHFEANISDYANPIHVTPVEIVNSLNKFFDRSGDNAYAEVAENGQVRIYSNTKGARSTISIQGGTLQPYLQLTEPISPGIGFEFISYAPWVVTNPRPGVVRFLVDQYMFTCRFSDIHVGDYVTIIGETFPLELRGSWPIIAVNYTAVNGSPNYFVQWAEIESSYVVPLPPT
jgi:hypothetical protein